MKDKHLLFKCSLNTKKYGDINHMVELGWELLFLRNHYQGMLVFDFDEDFLNMIGFIDDSLRKELLDDKH